MPLPEVGWLRNAHCTFLRVAMSCDCRGTTTTRSDIIDVPCTFTEWPQASAAVMNKQQEIVQELELRRRMKAVVVPTNDGEVRRLLRELGEPITLFGEREV